MKYFKSKKNTGFTLLFSSLVVSILMSIGFTISNITLSQLLLSSSGRESQFAFYNADTGVECAMYYEYRVSHSTGGSFFPPNSGTPPNTVDSFTCNGVTASVISIIMSPDLSSATTTFSINHADPADPTICDKTKPSFKVLVSKTPASAPAPVGATSVYVQSRGYNTCDASNPKRVERGLYAKFTD